MSPGESHITALRWAFEAAVGHQNAGRFSEAEALYRQVLEAAPDHPDSLHHLGQIAAHGRDFDRAADLMTRAVMAAGGKATAKLHFDLGVTLHKAGRTDEAIPAMEKAVTHRPDHLQALRMLGAFYWSLRRANGAIGAYERLLALTPDAAEAHNGLGLAYGMVNRLPEAIAAFERAIALRPDFTEAYTNMAVAYSDAGDVGRAVAVMDRLLAWAPDDADAQCKRAMLDLLRGDLGPGWDRLEQWRPRTGMAAPIFSQPVWDGGDLTGKAILLHDMQGVGDILQFARYAAMVKARGAATVIAGAHPTVAGLLATVRGVDQIAVIGERLPAFDTHIPLMGLPRVFGTTLENMPADVPYVAARAEDVARWRAGRGSDARLSVGLVWHGNPKQLNNPRRSTTAADVAPLCAMPGVRWICLQADATAEELAVLESSGPIESYGLLTDWSDTAALVETLDLVITVDTGVAHLAGAMGKPVWVMLSFSADWRYLLGRSDSPWYPTMRLFRQPSPGDWESVVSDVRCALEKLRG